MFKGKLVRGGKLVPRPKNGFTKESSKKIRAAIHARQPKSKLPIETIITIETIIHAALTGKVGQLELFVGDKKIRMVAVPDGLWLDEGSNIVLKVPREMGKTMEVKDVATRKLDAGKDDRAVQPGDHPPGVPVLSGEQNGDGSVTGDLSEKPVLETEAVREGEG